MLIPNEAPVEQDYFHRSKLTYGTQLSSFAFKFNLRRHIKEAGRKKWGNKKWGNKKWGGEIGEQSHDAGADEGAVHADRGQGLTLVHFSARPEPVLVTDATATVHF